MGRHHKSGEIKIKSYALQKETIDSIKELAEFEGMNKSEFISFLVTNWENGVNPSNKLNSLLERRKSLNLTLTELDAEISKQMKYIKYYDDLKKQKSMKKQQAIMTIKRKLLDRDFEGVEKISKVWGRITGLQPMELIVEANEIIRNSGI